VFDPCRHRWWTLNPSDHPRPVNGYAFDPLDQVVDRLGRSVADVGLVPGGDLQLPTDERAPEGACLDWIVLVLEIVAELGHPLEGEIGIPVRVELADGLFRFPARGHIPVGIAGPQEPGQLLVALGVEPLLRLGQQAPAPIEGIGLAAPMPEGLVLYPPAALVELGVGELRDMEGIGHQGGLGHHELEHPLVGAGEVEGAVLDAVPKGSTLLGQPGHRTCTAATRDDVQELASTDVDDLGGEVLSVERAEADHEHFVEAEGGDRTEPVPVRLQEGFAVGDDGVVHGVPVTTELAGHLVHAPGMSADLDGHPPGRPRREDLSRGGDPVVRFGPGTHRTVIVGALPPSLVPDEPGRTSLQRQVDQVDPGPILDSGDRPTLRTAGASGVGLDVDPGLATRSVLDAQEGDVGKSDHPHQRARRVSLHGGPPSSVVEQPKTGGPPLRARGSSYCTPLISEAPV
jgi:hypothetical protein